MIRQLRRRMTLMVIAVLVLVSAGIVLAIHLANGHSIAAQAADSLSVLAEQDAVGIGLRPKEEFDAVELAGSWPVDEARQ